MFAGLETIGENPARSWTAIFSFTGQAAIVAAVLMIPLLNPQSLPEALVKRRIFVPMLSGDVHVQLTRLTGPLTGAERVRPIIVNINPHFTFHQPPTEAIGSENLQTPNLLIGSSAADEGVQNSITEILARPVPHPIAAVPPTRISVVMEGNLVHRVEPTYPAIAKQAGIEGTVVIKAIISRAGAIEQEQVVSGPPLLVRAAVDAVHQWKYRPYLLNGEAVEVETQVTVRFVLNR
jgi:periplasmic protein TonB